MLWGRLVGLRTIVVSIEILFDFLRDSAKHSSPTSSDKGLCTCINGPVSGEEGVLLLDLELSASDANISVNSSLVRVVSSAFEVCATNKPLINRPTFSLKD